jgi:hypothetical protein
MAFMLFFTTLCLYSTPFHSQKQTSDYHEDTCFTKYHRGLEWGKEGESLSIEDKGVRPPCPLGISTGTCVRAISGMVSISGAKEADRQDSVCLLFLSSPRSVWQPRMSHVILPPDLCQHSMSPRTPKVTRHMQGWV